MDEATSRKSYAIFGGLQSAELRETLLSSGGSVIEIPVPKIIWNDDPVDNQNLARFEWIVIGDAFAAEWFIRHFGSAEDLDSARFCSLGESTAEALRLAQIHSDVIPSRTDPKSSVEALLQYETDLSGINVLVVASFEYAERLSDELIATGAVVSRFDAYRAEFESKSEIARVRSLFIGGAIDEFYFLDPTEITFLALLIDLDTSSEIRGEVRVVTANPAVYRSAVEAGLGARIRSKR